MNQFNPPQMNNPYGAFTAAPPMPFADHEPLQHSGLGIASFILALVSGLSVIALIVVAGFMEASTPGGVDEDDPAVIVLGLTVCAGAIAAVVGLALGIAGAVQRHRKKVFAVLGLVFNALVVLSVAGLMVIGMLNS